jgi:molybdopterin converting factor small subunit
MAKDLVGADTVEVALPAGATLGDLRKALAAEHRPLAALVAHAMFAIGARYASDDTVLDADAGEIALIPPVSGG